MSQIWCCCVSYVSQVPAFWADWRRAHADLPPLASRSLRGLAGFRFSPYGIRTWGHAPIANVDFTVRQAEQILFVGSFPVGLPPLTVKQIEHSCDANDVGAKLPLKPGRQNIFSFVRLRFAPLLFARVFCISVFAPKPFHVVWD